MPEAVRLPCAAPSIGVLSSLVSLYAWFHFERQPGVPLSLYVAGVGGAASVRVWHGCHGRVLSPLSQGAHEQQRLGGGCSCSRRDSR